jgi:CopG-like RHH_1 or ribbon-helix-helix domain, RHH_5
VARKAKPKSERRTAIAVYLPPKVLDTLKRAAEKDRRTASTLAMILIERGLSSDSSN